MWVYNIETFYRDTIDTGTDTGKHKDTEVRK